MEKFQLKKIYQTKFKSQFFISFSASKSFLNFQNPSTGCGGISTGKEDCLVNIFKFIQEIFDIYFQSEDMANFLHLQGKLKSSNLKKLYAFNRGVLTHKKRSFRPSGTQNNVFKSKYWTVGKSQLDSISCRVSQKSQWRHH